MISINKCIRYWRRVFLLFYVGLLCSVCNAVSNGTSSCGANLSIKTLTNEPAYQSTASSLLLTSPLDTSVEYLCSAGSGYDSTGVTCYSLKCPATPYGNVYGQPYNQPYGSRGPGSPYTTPNKPPYGAQGPSPLQTVTVGAQVVAVETAYPCWKLKQVRLNQYVYIICFVRNYNSPIFQITFKDNYQLEMVQTLVIPYNALSAVSVLTYTTDAQLTCLAAFFSTYQGSHLSDPLTQPSDLLAPIYTLCPNNYQWAFCGNIPVASTVDVSTLLYNRGLEVFFVTRCSLDGAVVPGTVLSIALPLPGVGDVDLSITCTQGSSAIAHYYIPTDRDLACSEAVLKETVRTIGCLRPDLEIRKIYQLCGITKTNIISKDNVTLLCAAVNTVLCQRLIQPDDSAKYSSFCALYDISTRTISREKIVFLEQATEATDIQYVRATGESCQFIVVTSLTGPLKFFCLSSVISAINNMTAGCDLFPAVSISPVSTGTDLSVFHNAVSCSFKAKCCNSPQTCITCTRPTKYGEHYLAELTCGSGYQNQNNVPTVYDDNNPYGLQQARGPFLLNPTAYGRPFNYTTLLQPYLQQPQLYNQSPGTSMNAYPPNLPYLQQQGPPYQQIPNNPRYA